MVGIADDAQHPGGDSGDPTPASTTSLASKRKITSFAHPPELLQDVGIRMREDFSAFAFADCVKEFFRCDVPQRMDAFPSFMVQSDELTQDLRMSAYHYKRAEDFIRDAKQANGVTLSPEAGALLVETEQLFETVKTGPEWMEETLRLCRERGDAAYRKCVIADCVDCDDRQANDERLRAQVIVVQAAMRKCPVELDAAHLCDAWVLVGAFEIVVHTSHEIAQTLQRVIDAYGFESVLQFQHFLHSLKAPTLDVASVKELNKASNRAVVNERANCDYMKGYGMRPVLRRAHAFRSRARWQLEFENIVTMNRYLSQKVRRLECELAHKDVVAE